MALMYPSINGVRASWAEIEFRIRRMTTLGVRAISYKPSLEPSEVYGAGVRPAGRTRGIAKFEGSIEMLKEESDVLLQVLGDGFGEVPFDIVANYRIDDGSPAQMRGAIHQDVLYGCRIKSVDQSFSQGPDGLVVKSDLSIMDIRLNGLSITSKTFASMLQ
jgi:hypothetical protein